MQGFRTWPAAATLLAAIAIGVFMISQWNGDRAPEATIAIPLGGPSLEDAPASVANREPLFYCGAEFLRGLGSPNPYEEVEVVQGATECYHERARAGQSSELVLLMVTVEGDPIMEIRRLMPDGREIIFWDATRDSNGAMAWLMIVCDGYTGSDQSEGECSEDVVLDG